MISKERTTAYLKENRGWILIGLAGGMVLQELVVLYYTVEYLGLDIGKITSDEIAITVFKFMHTGTLEANAMWLSDKIGSLVWIPLVLGVYFYIADKKIGEKS